MEFGNRQLMLAFHFDCISHSALLASAQLDSRGEVMLLRSTVPR